MRWRSPSWRETSLAVVDLELTGLDARADEIVSWAVVPVDGGAIDARRIRAGLVRPERSSPDAAIRIHGLRDDDLASAAQGRAAWEELCEALDGRVLVAHAAFVELRFLAPVLRTCGRRPIRDAIDTAELFAFAAPDVRTEEGRVVELGMAARHYGLPVHAPHTASGDALTTAQLFLALAAHLEDGGRQTVRRLMNPPHHWLHDEREGRSRR